MNDDTYETTVELFEVELDVFGNPQTPVVLSPDVTTVQIQDDDSKLAISSTSLLLLMFLY